MHNAPLMRAPALQGRCADATRADDDNGVTLANVGSVDRRPVSG